MHYSKEIATFERNIPPDEHLKRKKMRVNTLLGHDAMQNISGFNHQSRRRKVRLVRKHQPNKHSIFMYFALKNCFFINILNRFWRRFASIGISFG